MQEEQARFTSGRSLKYSPVIGLGTESGKKSTEFMHFLEGCSPKKQAHPSWQVAPCACTLKHHVLQKRPGR